MIKKILLIAIACLFLIQCSTKVSPPPAPPAPGETAFNATCKRCHALPRPDKHTGDEWPNTMNRMQDKAHFSDEQKTEILIFLTANAKK